jgi:hypothetical protein
LRKDLGESFMAWSLNAFLLLAAAVQPAPPTSETSGLAKPSASEEKLIAHSTSIGKTLYTFDRAAWISTDALMKKVPRDHLSGPGGYVVEPVDAETVRVTYYRGMTTEARAFFTADIRDGKVVRDELLPEPVALTPRQAALAAARSIGAEAAASKGYKPCTAAPFNTVVLPSPDGGPTAVYLLSAQKETSSYPMGGYYRVMVGADGTVLDSRPFSNSCLVMKVPKPSARAESLLFVTHLLDPAPTEIHVFISHSLNVSLIVGTSETRIWQVAGSNIVAADLAP